MVRLWMAFSNRFHMTCEIRQRRNESLQDLESEHLGGRTCLAEVGGRMVGVGCVDGSGVLLDMLTVGFLLVETLGKPGDILG